MNEIEALNQSLFLRISGEAGTPTWIVDTALVVGDYFICLIPTLLLVLWLWGNAARRNLALKACLVAMLGVGINQVIPLFWQHPAVHDRTWPRVDTSCVRLVVSE